VGTAVLIRTVYDVTVKEQSVSRIELDMDKFQTFEQCLYPFQVGTRLSGRRAMIETTTFVRTSENLQTTVLSGRPVDGNHATGHIRVQTMVMLVPISVILVPLPGTANQWFLDHHFVMEVINLIPQQFLRCTDDTFTFYTGAINIVMQVVVNSQLADPALGILAAMCFFHIAVGFCNSVEQVRFLLVKELTDNEVAVIVKLLD